MTKMQAVQITKFGGPEVLQVTELPIPVPKPDQVLVKLEVAGVNYSDTNWRDGIRGGNPPMVNGAEGAGTVAAVGNEVGNLSEGDRIAYWNPDIGSYAEYAICPAFRVVKLPDEMEFETGAALMLQGLTAHYLIRSTFEVKEGHAILFHAGAGGVGQIAIQIAKAKGAQILVTVSSEEKAAFARNIGADEVIRYDQVDFSAATRDYTGGEGVHAVYDSVGAATWEGSLKSLRTRGTAVYYGNSSGPLPNVDLAILAQMGSLSVVRTTLKDYVRDQEEISWRAGELFDLWREGKLNIFVGQVYPLSEASRAHAELQARSTIGKLLLMPGS